MPLSAQEKQLCLPWGCCQGQRKLHPSNSGTCFPTKATISLSLSRRSEGYLWGLLAYQGIQRPPGSLTETSPAGWGPHPASHSSKPYYFWLFPLSYSSLVTLSLGLLCPHSLFSLAVPISLSSHGQVQSVGHVQSTTFSLSALASSRCFISTITPPTVPQRGHVLCLRIWGQTLFIETGVSFLARRGYTLKNSCAFIYPCSPATSYSQ